MGRLSGGVDSFGFGYWRYNESTRWSDRDDGRTCMVRLFVPSLQPFVRNSRPLIQQNSIRWFLSTYLPLHPSPSIRRPNPIGAPRWFLNLFGAPTSTTEIRGGGFTATRGGFGAATRATEGSGATAGSTGRRTGYNWGRGGQRLGGEGL